MLMLFDILGMLGLCFINEAGACFYDPVLAAVS